MTDKFLHCIWEVQIGTYIKVVRAFYEEVLNEESDNDELFSKGE